LISAEFFGSTPSQPTKARRGCVLEVEGESAAFMTISLKYVIQKFQHLTRSAHLKRRTTSCAAIHHALDAGGAQFLKKLTGGFFGETDRENIDGFGWHKIRDAPQARRTRDRRSWHRAGRKLSQSIPRTA
jgi:hypothetical protein